MNQEASSPSFFSLFIYIFGVTFALFVTVHITSSWTVREANERGSRDIPWSGAYNRPLREGSGPLCDASLYTAFAAESKWKHIAYRDSIGTWLQELGFVGSGAELGVLQGQFAQQTLSGWTSVNKYYLVDPWAHQDPEKYVDFANKGDEEQNENMEQAILNTATYQDKVVFVRNFSTDAVKMFEDCSLDYVYVDAVHDYRGALTDLTDWWPKIRPGGIMAGHDFIDSIDPFWGVFNVKSAVEHFSAAVAAPFWLTDDPVMPSFWIAKPCL